jgi:hypothetical protein
MARRVGTISVLGVATGTSLKTLLQLVAATNHAIAIIELGISFHGTSNTAEPILCQLMRQTTAGTMSAASVRAADDSIGDTFDTTGQHTATAEPTASDVLRAWSVHPQTGLVWQAHDLAPVIVGAGDRIGLTVTAGASVNADCYLVFEE